MYKAELVGGEHDGLVVQVESSNVPEILMPTYSTGPAICNPDDVKITEANNIVVDRYIRQVFQLNTGKQEPRWVLVSNGVPIL